MSLNIQKKSLLSTQTSFYDNLLNPSSTQTIENFMKYLKYFYNYDEVTLYTYEKNDKKYESSIFDDALDFIGQSKYVSHLDNHIDSLKSSINNYFDVLRIVKLTQKYERNSVDHYLIIDVYSNKENEYKILIPTVFNVSNLINVNPIPNRIYELNQYKDIIMFIEFKEKKTVSTDSFIGFNVNNYCFETVLEINFETNPSAPILQHEPSTIHNGYGLTFANYKRKAQFVLKHYPVVTNNKIDYLLDMKIIFGNKIIKHDCISSASVIVDINKIINKFIFPLAEDSESIKHLNLEPEFTAEFMSQDFTDFWDLKMMVAI
jgi:hypothetical protein